MLVDLERVPPEGQTIERRIEPSTLSFDSNEFRIKTAVDVAAQLIRADGDKYRLRGRLVTDVELACVRCLEPISDEVREELDLLYLPQSENVAAEGEQDHGLGDEELAVSYYRDDAIDLSHMIWEQIVLALPMKPVCKLDCKGLCPQCGINKNIETCSCVLDTGDPRWESLKSLLES